MNLPNRLILVLWKGEPGNTDEVTMKNMKVMRKDIAPCSTYCTTHQDPSMNIKEDTRVISDVEWLTILIPTSSFGTTKTMHL